MLSKHVSVFLWKVTECNRVERHVGRLSQLTTVSRVLIQTETSRGEDYSRLFEHPSEKALQRRYYAKHPAISKVLFVRVEPSRTRHLVSCPSVFLFGGGGKQGFMEDIYQLAFPHIISKQMIRMPKSACVEGTGAEPSAGASAQTFLSPQWLCLEWMISSPKKRLAIALSLRWQEAVVACWLEIEKVKMFLSLRQRFFLCFLFYSDEANTRPSSSALTQAVHIRHFQSPQLQKGGVIDSSTSAKDLSV